MTVTKPPFAVPTMAEIAKVEPNGLTVVSTFSGGGGSCTGYRMAGYQVVWANEFEPTAAATYAANHPEVHLDTRNIRDVQGSDILEAIGLDSIDVLDGSPPCQSFSMAGKRSKGWGQVIKHSDNTTQRSDDLFGEYIRLVGELRPRAFIAENVKGLVMGVSKGQFKRIMRSLTELGYRVGARLLDAQWLGVPQMRQRVFIVGIRNDLNRSPAYPAPLPYRYSIADACPWIVRMGSDGGLSASYMPRQVINAESGVAPTVMADSFFNQSLTGQRKYWVEARPVSRRGRPDLPHRRWEIPNPFAREATVNQTAPTILASNAGWSDFVVENRKLTIDEVKRLCSFPDDYKLPGSYDQQWARLGNSVPPLMARAVGQAVAHVINQTVAA